MRQLGYLLATVLMVTALTGGTVAARDIEWCAEDPVFKVLGSHFRVTTTIQAAASSVESISYVVSVPRDAGDTATAHYPQGRRLPTTVEINNDGVILGDPSTFLVTVSILVSGPSGASVTAYLSGPDVAADSWTFAAGSSFSKTFSVSR